MILSKFRPFRRILPVVAALGLSALSGCVAYPAGPGYGYGYGYAPAPVVVAPAPVVVGVGVGGCCWRGGGWGRWGGGWHR